MENSEVIVYIHTITTLKKSEKYIVYVLLCENTNMSYVINNSEVFVYIPYNHLHYFTRIRGKRSTLCMYSYARVQI